MINWKDIEETLFDKRPRTFISEKATEFAFFAIGTGTGLWLVDGGNALIVTVLWALYVALEFYVRHLGLVEKVHDKNRKELEEKGVI